MSADYHAALRATRPSEDAGQAQDDDSDDDGADESEDAESHRVLRASTSQESGRPSGGKETAVTDETTRAVDPDEMADDAVDEAEPIAPPPAVEPAAGPPTLPPADPPSRGIVGP